MPRMFAARTEVQVGSSRIVHNGVHSCREAWLGQLMSEWHTTLNSALRSNGTSIDSLLTFMRNGSYNVYSGYVFQFITRKTARVKVTINIVAAQRSALDWMLAELRQHYEFEHVFPSANVDSMTTNVWERLEMESMASSRASAVRNEQQLEITSVGWDGLAVAWWMILLNRLWASNTSASFRQSTTIRDVLRNSSSNSGDSWYNSADRDRHVQYWDAVVARTAPRPYATFYAHGPVNQYQNNHKMRKNMRKKYIEFCKQMNITRTNVMRALVGEPIKKVDPKKSLKTSKPKKPAVPVEG